MPDTDIVRGRVRARYGRAATSVTGGLTDADISPAGVEVEFTHEVVAGMHGAVIRVTRPSA